MLETPIQIGPFTCRNRLMSLPHDASFVDNGMPTESYVAYVKRISEGTAGIFVLGAAAAHPNTLFSSRHIRLYDHDVVKPLGKMVDAAHRAGTLFVAQLGHLGRDTKSWQEFRPTWAPSQLTSPYSLETPVQIGSSEFDELKEHYLASAKHVFEAGADGLEVHGAQGYLIHQFLSPWTNRRTDEYGGSLENRARFLRELLEMLRSASEGKILGLKISAGDEFDEGLTFAEVRDLLVDLDSAGLFDYVTLCVPQMRPHNHLRDASFNPGGLRAHTRELKKRLRVPVVITQRVDTPETAISILDEGDASIIGLARAVIADAEWGEKARAGRSDLIRPCIACMQDCRRDTSLSGLACAVNPEFGFAKSHRTSQLQNYEGKCVAVIGGGPAGCQAAMAAADAGATVKLFDRNQKLGGRARIAGMAPHRSPWATYADYLQTAVAENPSIEITTGRAPSAAEIAALAADLVVVATGAASTSVPTNQIAGVDADELITGKVELSGIQSAVVFDPYGTWPAGNAVDVLIDAGVKVTYATSHERVGHQIPREGRDTLLQRFDAHAVDVRTRLVMDPGPRSGRLSDEVLQLAAAADLVVWVGQEIADRTMEYELRAAGVQALVIGDALAPRGLSRAVHEGAGLISHLGRQFLESPDMSAGATR